MVEIGLRFGCGMVVPLLLAGCDAERAGGSPPPSPDRTPAYSDSGSSVTGCAPRSADLAARPYAFAGTVVSVEQGDWHGGAAFPTPLTIKVEIAEVYRGELPDVATIHTWEDLWSQRSPDGVSIGDRILLAPNQRMVVSDCRFGGSYSVEDSDEWSRIFDRVR